MTFDEVLESGKKKLLEYEPGLKGKVRGIKPFDRLKAKRVSGHYEGSILSAREDAIADVVGGVLESLVAQEGGFWMSEPAIETPVGLERGYQAATVRLNDVNMTFLSGYSISDNTDHLWVDCWFYPASRLL